MKAQTGLQPLLYSVCDALNIRTDSYIQTLNCVSLEKLGQTSKAWGWQRGSYGLAVEVLLKFGLVIFQSSLFLTNQ